MAHAANISQLTDKLVRSIISRNSDDVPFGQLRDNASRSLKTSGHSRTNQFEIRSIYSGLVEKFAVLNREDLADALQSRFDALPGDSKWLPEILSLLLKLSDRPVEKTNLEDVHALAAHSDDAMAKLTWEDISAEEGPDEDGLWDDVERGYHSSGDDATVDGTGDSDYAASTQATSIGEQDATALASLQIVNIELVVLNEVKSFHHQLVIGDRSGAISELTLIRETILMLHGLTTNIYDIDDSTGRILPHQDVRLSTATSCLVLDTMLHFAEIGYALRTLRRWVHIEQDLAYLQSCQAALQTLLSQFAMELSVIEQRYLSFREDIVVSVIDIKAAIGKLSRPLVSVSRVLGASQAQSTASPFALLDMLHEESCITELSGDYEVHQAILPVLFAGLRTYLRSISNWMLRGMYDVRDPSSLVKQVNADCPLSSFWQDRYAMRTLSNGKPNTPQCIQRFALRAFALGKSRAFLYLLNGTDAGSDDDTGAVPLDFAQDESNKGLLSFSQVLDVTVEAWISKIAKDATSALREAIMSKHGLMETISNLNHMFCSEDGIAFQTFADSLFRSMKHSSKALKNAFLLTELAQSTLGVPTRPQQRLIVRVDDDVQGGNKTSSVRILQSIHLDTSLPWALQNITRSPSPTTYSKTLTLLLQIYRAKTLLKQHFRDLKPLAKADAEITHGNSTLLRLSMLLMAFVDVFLTHTTTTAALMKRSLLLEITKVADVDAMAEVWDRHDNHMATTVLLSQKLDPLKKTVFALLENCEQCHVLWEGAKTNNKGNDGDDINTAATSAQIQGKARRLRGEVDNSLTFLIAGLRGTSRASGNTALEALADRLNCIVH